MEAEGIKLVIVKRSRDRGKKERVLLAPTTPD